MDQVKLRRLLKRIKPIDFQMYQQIDSTNLAAKRQALVLATKEKPTLLLANEQTAGYGRQGRPFLSPRSVGLYMTLVLPGVKLKQLDAGQVTITMAVATAQAISRTVRREVSIKWVNDIYYLQHKVAGILVEGWQQDGQSALMIGLGLNLMSADYPLALQKKVGSLALDQVDKASLVAAIIERFFYLQTQPFAQVMAIYRNLSCLQHRNVILQVAGQQIRGQVTGFDQHGGIQLETDQGQRTFYSGEVIKVNVLPKQ